MNTDIANWIKSKIEGLSFVDKIAGVVRVATMAQPTDNVSILKKFPVSCNLTAADCRSGKFRDLIPSSDKKSVIYFEDLGVTFVSRNRGSFKFQSTLKLVGWINGERFSSQYCDTSSFVIAAILAALPSTPQTYNGMYSHITISGAAIDPKSPAIFQKYTYDEQATQYLMSPYDYFAITINTSFVVHESCVALLQEAENCPAPISVACPECVQCPEVCESLTENLYTSEESQETVYNFDTDQIIPANGSGWVKSFIGGVTRWTHSTFSDHQFLLINIPDAIENQNDFLLFRCTIVTTSGAVPDNGIIMSLAGADYLPLIGVANGTIEYARVFRQVNQNIEIAFDIHSVPDSLEGWTGYISNIRVQKIIENFA